LFELKGNNSFPSTPTHKIHINNIKTFSIANNNNNNGEYLISTFVPVKGASPANISIYNYNNSNNNTTIICSRSIFKAESVQMKWSNNNTDNCINMLVLAQTASDKSGSSYYGETNLFLFSPQLKGISIADNENSSIQISFNSNPGPIHDFAFNPTGKHFIVIQGNTPGLE
jgi:translation initiation factor 2A